MPTIDTYKSKLLRKKEELAKLNCGLAEKQAEIALQEKKIAWANSIIGRTDSQATRRLRRGDKERAEREIANIEKTCDDIQKKIAQKKREIAEVEKCLYNEEARMVRRRRGR